MSFGPELLLVGAVAAVGVLHTIVPDHWVPISVIARQRGWSKGETARASLLAGLGHVLSTLLIALVVWLAGVVIAARFGQVVDTAASIALVAFGAWTAIAAWRELRGRGGHGHSHAHHIEHLGGGDIHGPERQTIATDHGELVLSIYESDVPPRFRLTGVDANAVRVETLRAGGKRQVFLFANHGTYWESVEEIPEPRKFEVVLTLEHDGEAHVFETRFAEHDHAHGDDHNHEHAHEHGPDPVCDPLYAPLRDDTAVLTRHVHIHRHGRGAPHTHWHDHFPETAHPVATRTKKEAPLHDHRHKTSGRTAVLLILGSSPMVEGIPAFFAAGKYGVALITVMSVVLAVSTIATYVLMCVFSTAGLQRIRLGAFERYGEVLSGAFIALVGVVFWVWPVL
jgi:ABC-type nickel/cobalt efflux system permease component RcnA